MSNDTINPIDTNKIIILGSFNLAGKSPGTYYGGVFKRFKDQKKDILNSAKSFLDAANRCLNGCKVEADMEILITPGTVCASFSCELFLKYILLVENNEEPKGHSLSDLFRKCNKEIQLALTNFKVDLLEIFERNKNQFVDSRYHHEKDNIVLRPQEMLQIAEFLSKFVTERYSNESA